MIFENFIHLMSVFLYILAPRKTRGTKWNANFSIAFLDVKLTGQTIRIQDTSDLIQFFIQLVEQTADDPPDAKRLP